MPSKSNPTVYSTEWGRICPTCGKPVDRCTCAIKKPASVGDGIVRVSRETKGRKGKGVTLVTGLLLDEDGKKNLLAEIKKKCGAGGSLKEGLLEIQGEHRDIIVELLKTKGYQVKKSGG